MKTVSLRGVIFDLDGIIVDTDALHHLAWERTCHVYGLRYDAQCAEATRGAGRMQSLLRILILNDVSEDIGNRSKVEICSHKNKIYREYLDALDANNITDGFFELHDYLRSRKISLGVASSSKNANLILQKLKLADLFDAIITGEDITYDKPHPEAFFKCCERIERTCHQCAAIEDSFSGLESALAAQLYTIYVGSNQTCVEQAQISIPNLCCWRGVPVLSTLQLDKHEP